MVHGREAVNKSQLIDTLSARFEGNKKAASHALEAVLDTITREVAKGEKVAITGFGSFEKRVRDARWVRNPRTGERIKAKKTAIPKFSPGADLKAVVSGAKKLPKLTLNAAATGAKTARRAAKKTTAKAVPAKKAPATKTAAKKAPATKAAAKKTTTTAKKAPAKTATASKTAAKKAPAKKTTTAAKKTATTAKKAPAKKATTPRRRLPPRRRRPRRPRRRPDRLLRTSTHRRAGPPRGPALLHVVRPGYDPSLVHCPSETTSTEPSTTVMAVCSSMA